MRPGATGGPRSGRGAALALGLGLASVACGSTRGEPRGPYVWSEEAPGEEEAEPAEPREAETAPAPGEPAEPAAAAETGEAMEPEDEVRTRDAAGTEDAPEPDAPEGAGIEPGGIEPDADAAPPEAPEDEPGPAAAGDPDDPLSFVTDVGPVPPAEWRIVPPPHREYGDTLSLQQPTRGFTVEGTIVQASPRTAFIAYEHRGPYHDLTFRDSIVRVDPGILPLDRSYWGIKAYDVIDMLLERVEITGFGQVTPKHDEGHAIYVNPQGSFTMVGCHVHHNGGQGLQLVKRPRESDFPGPAEGTIAIRQTRFLENGFNPDRGAFQVSIFGTGQAIEMEDVLIAAGFDDTRYPGGLTGGGLLIEAEWSTRRPVWWRPAEPPEDFEPPFTSGPTELLRVHVHQRDANRSIVQIKGCEELVVRDCTFGPGRIDLDSPTKPGRDCGKIVWEGNRGPATVHHRGRPLGPADHDFVIEPEDG